MPEHVRFLRRKNFFPAAIVSAILWICWATIFFFVPPEQFFIPILFIIVTFFSALFTGSLLFASSRRGLLIAIGSVILMILRYLEVGNYLNIILVLGILLSIEYYLSRNRG